MFHAYIEKNKLKCLKRMSGRINQMSLFMKTEQIYSHVNKTGGTALVIKISKNSNIK